MPFGAVRVPSQRWQNFLLRAGIRQPAKILEPTALLFCLEGWPPPGPNHFRWKKNELVYMLPTASLDCRDWDKVAKPTRMQWRQFWRVCEETGIWSWPPSLGNRHICDGLQWVLELEYAHRRVVSRGQVSGSPAGFSKRLYKFHQTLQTLSLIHIS